MGRMEGRGGHVHGCWCMDTIDLGHAHVWHVAVVRIGGLVHSIEMRLSAKVAQPVEQGRRRRAALSRLSISAVYIAVGAITDAHMQRWTYLFEPTGRCARVEPEMLRCAPHARLAFHIPVSCGWLVA